MNSIEEPIGFKNSRIDCYWSKIKNQNRSDNYGVSCALLVDTQNKTFAFYRGISYMVDWPSTTYLKSVKLLSSDKKVREKVAFFAGHGYKNTCGEAKLEDYRVRDKDIKEIMYKYDFGR